MHRFIVAVIDGTKARLLTLEPVAAPEHESGPNLVEQCELFSATKEMSGQDLWTTTKTGRNRGRGSQGHNYDDHRTNHLVEFERRFAQTIVEQINTLNQSLPAKTLVLAAEPQILGLMRDCLNGSAKQFPHIHELSKDLCHLKPKELHEYLTQKGLLPAHQRVLSSRFTAAANAHS
ncbi:MAG: host attachment protein [Cyanobacteria bacterium Co-bin13]|nr:host attachment protein [Cyanobacteria bacterium Co-bin13]